MADGDDFHVAAFAPEHAEALARLFERAGASCYCRYWHFTGDKNAWLERRAHQPEQNRAELLECARRRDHETRGLVAFARERGAEDALVGWMKLAPAPTLSKLTEQRPYRRLPQVARDRDDCYLIGCFLVDPALRRRGVARALLRAAPAIARGWGARMLQAFPYQTQLAQPELLWLGPSQLFVELGFRELPGVGPYPIMCLDL